MLRAPSSRLPSLGRAKGRGNILLNWANSQFSHKGKHKWYNSDTKAFPTNFLIFSILCLLLKFLSLQQNKSLDYGSLKIFKWLHLWQLKKILKNKSKGMDRGERTQFALVCLFPVAPEPVLNTEWNWLNFSSNWSRLTWNEALFDTLFFV